MAFKDAHELDSGKMKIDLRGPQGNAYYLLAVAADLSKKLEMNWPKIEKEMTSGDYENLLRVFDNNFGYFVDLYR